MSDRDARFRRLRPGDDRTSATSRTARPDLDLFAHFGIELEPAAASEPITSATAIACARCRWYVRRVESSCPVCGQPMPAGATP